MKKAIVNLEQDTDRAVSRRDTPEQILYKDIENTYLKYMYKYGTVDIIIVTNKVEEQFYKFGAEEIQIINSTPLTRLLNHKPIINTIINKNTDQTEVTYEDGDTIQWINLPSKDAESAGITPKTKRIHKKSDKQIRKENQRLLIYQILKVILPIPLIVYSYNTKNIIGLGVMTGITLAFLLKLIYDREYTYPYERRV